MKTSSVKCKENTPLIIIRKDILDFCDGNTAAAALFSFLSYWHDNRVEYLSKLINDGELERPYKYKEIKKQSQLYRSLLHYHSTEEIIDGLMGIAKSRSSILKARNILKEKGVLREYKNPLFKLDKTIFYEFNPLKFNKFLESYNSNDFRLTKNSHSLRKKRQTSTEITNTDINTSFNKEDIVSQAKRKKSPDDDLSRFIKKHNLANKKIIKKPKTKPVDPKKSVYKPKYKINATDTAWYIALKIAGATNHREGTKSKAKTFDMIHAIAKHSMANPYNILPDVSDFYKKYKWTREEILDIFQYQLKHCADFGYKPIKNFAHFIITKNYNGDNRVWCPLIFWHRQFDKVHDGELSEDGKKLYKALRKRNIPEYDKFSVKDLNDIADWCIELKKDYVLLTGDNQNGTYKLGMISVFADYTKKMVQKDRGFRYFWVKGWDKFGEFKRYAVKTGMIKLRQR